jgi:hypothetical protein
MMLGPKPTGLLCTLSHRRDIKTRVLKAAYIHISHLSSQQLGVGHNNGLTSIYGVRNYVMEGRSSWSHLRQANATLNLSSKSSALPAV